MFRLLCFASALPWPQTAAQRAKAQVQSARRTARGSLVATHAGKWADVSLSYLCQGLKILGPPRREEKELAPMPLDEKTRTELEAAAFRRLLEHLRARTDVQNIDLMNLAGFAAIVCRTG
jgi:hypothetical protein